MTISINGESYPAQAFRAQDGVVLYVPQLERQDAPYFYQLFKDVPQEFVGRGWVGVGHWDGFRYDFETRADLLLGPDGTVWAQICGEPERLPEIDDQEDPIHLSPHYQADVFRRQRAFKILEEAEELYGAIEMARDEASVDHWPLPVSVEDYLFWIEEEAFIQSHYKSYFADDPTGPSYSETLQSVANELRSLGFKPSQPPWERETL
jgi:hypothetical protein